MALEHRAMINRVMALIILNASFEGANLNNATWVNGKKCDLGSIGECKAE